MLTTVKGFLRIALSALAAAGLGATATTAQTYEVVHRFRYSEATIRPDAASESRLILAPDGYFYGTTYWGGASGFGTIYRMDSASTVTTLHSFAYADGANPAAGLVHSSDGAFYGTTEFGGTHNLGTVFRMESSGAVTRLHSFDGAGGQQPLASLIQASDGKFYGTTSLGGGNGVGTVFRIDSSGGFALLHSFDYYVDGARPVAELLEARGALYGTTSQGGTNALGTVFRMDFAGAITTIRAFAGTDGQNPSAALIQSVSGDLYGTASHGGANGAGTVFRVDVSDEVTTLHSFDSNSEGGIPRAPLLQGNDGAFYGTAWAGGGSNKGTVFRITDSGIVTLLHGFDGTDSANPAVGLVQDLEGNLYGATSVAATIYRIDSSLEFTTLYSFGWRDGVGPAFLLQATDGFIYGTTWGGGTSNQGTIFRMDLSGEVAFLHNFEGGLDGAGAAHLMQASDGEIYGTDDAGANGLGRIFRLEPSGDTTTLHSFDGYDGVWPTGLTDGGDGKLYGTATHTFFRIDTSGGFEGLASFGDDYGMAYPNGPLVAGSGGFYGTTAEGCHLLLGCIFKASPETGISIQYGFAEDGSEGVVPLTPLIDADGTLWGTTSSAGEYGSGTVFWTIAGGAYVDIAHSFTSEEGTPNSLSFAAGGLYGTSVGFQTPKGTIFSMGDGHNLTTIYAFPGQMDGGYPTAPIQGSDGLLYGTAGVIYRLSDATVAVNQIMPTSGPASAGAALIVIGGGFTDSSVVTVGSAEGTDLAVLDSTFLYLFTPPLSPGTMNDVSVTVPDPGFGNATATRPNAFFADFADVPQIDPFHDYVEKIVRNGVTAGCGAGSYCPQDAVTRAQMAVFLLKSKHGSAFVPPTCAGIFADVACPSMFADWIEQLAAEGITAGCGGGNYCPSNPVTRAQMAAFLLKAEHGSAYVPPSCVGVFADVSCPSLFADWIEQLAAEQITGGCGGSNYCPDNPNTRAQMSAFLVKTFHM